MMNDLWDKINLVLNECSITLNALETRNIDGPVFYATIFKNFSNGPLLQFVKSIQTFFKTFKSQNVFMLCVCLSQIRKCLIMFEETTSKYNTISNFEKVVCIYLMKRIQKCFFKLEDFLEMLDLTDIDGQPGIFIDQMNTVLNNLNDRLELKLFKPKIDKIIFQAITLAKISDVTNNLELTASSKHVLKAIENFEKINIEENDFFHFDYLSSSLSILERRINTAVLNLIYKIFNDPFYAVKKLLQMCANLNNFHTRNSLEFSSYVSDLDKSTDVLIQVGLFAVACCKNNEYVISLKSCISSLELLDSDLVPAIIEFYLDPVSEEKKQFLKLLINHWINEIFEIQNLLEKIIDPFAYAQTTLETSTDIITTIQKTNSSIDEYNKLLNGFINFKKFIGNLFRSEIYKENEFSKTYNQYENALKEYKAYLVFIESTNDDVDNDITKKKLLKRCTIVLKYLTNIQTSIFNVMNNKSFPAFENTSYILSKTKQSSDSFVPYENINSDNFNLIFSTVQIQKSFYNKFERKMSNTLGGLDYCLSLVNKTTNENTVIMELTNILDDCINTFYKTNHHMTSANIWEEINTDPHTRFQDLKNVHNQIWSAQIS